MPHPRVEVPAHPVSALPIGTWVVVAGFGVSGVLHLVRPQVFEPLIPPTLGDPGPWIVGSGVVELVCAGGLLGRARWAPGLTAATLLVIWVGNVQHAIRIHHSTRTSRTMRAAALARLPLQLPLIRWALASPTRAPEA